ncbi:M60 family metallopeptidase [Malacoplasma iowae]|uniref:M60 family metallopeptidase n=1 Tax=Malacoplasma iowae TaxID=2116 RepID=UPI0038736F77|nr:M60 family metallopeptidase [Malacoplasma iowae]
MKKEKKKRFIYSSIGAFALLGSFSTIGISFAIGPTILNNISKPPLINSSGNNNQPYVGNTDKPYYFKREIVNENVTRTPNKNTYQTPITKKYNSQFKWPSWNYNYEVDPDGSGPKKQNKFQTINGQKINAEQLVYNEDFTDMVVTDNNGNKQNLKFSDPRFILEEIKNNNLKKHPAADVWFEQNISDTEKAVDVSYSIPSSISGPTALGLYAPPGEILTLKFSDKTFESLKRNNVNNFQVVINSSFYDNKNADEDSGGISNRYPFVKTTFDVSVTNLENNNKEFKFGSPFGGTVSVFVRSGIKSSTSNDVYKSFDNFEFNVSGGLKTLSYYNGYTSEQEWNNDLQNVIDGKLTAPSMSIDFSYGSMNIASTGKNKFAYLDASKISYPKKVMEKWNDFLFLSEYFAGRDLDNSVTKTDFEFCDDIWGGAGAWGGGNALYAPLSWAQSSFLKGVTDWSINNNWGVFHEINHNFQQNGALFNKISHGKTNEVTMFNLSLISDTGRWRDLYNPASEFGGIGHWTGMQNMYSTVLNINETYENNKNYDAFNNSEYEIQNIILNTLGSQNYADYVRWDTRNGTDTSGLDTIVELSNYFGINFYPALANFHKIWNDGWPESYSKASSDQKRKINSINNLKSQDFVANIYAAGPYLYNTYKNTLTYTNDMQPAFEIAAGKPFTFDFEKGIISPNLNFNFSSLIFDSKTKYGGSLKLDPNNNKKLIYTPNKKYIDKIDEFDVGIKVNYKGMPSNYVDQIRWKIKVRQVANQPVITLYKDNYPKGYNTNKISDDYQYLKDEANFVQSKTSDPRRGPLSTRTDKGNWHRYKISFSFVAPKTANYKFQIKTKNGNGAMNAFIVNNSVSNDIWWKSNSAISNWTDTKTIKLNKNETTSFEIYTHTELNKSSKVEFRAIADNDTQNPIDVFENAVVPWANELSNNPSEFINDEKYKFQERKLNYNSFQTSMYGLKSSRKYEPIKKEDDNNFVNYKFALNGRNDFDEIVSKKDNRVYEKLNLTPNESINFNVDFANPTEIRTIEFDHRSSNWWWIKPEKIMITDDQNNILIDDNYEKFFQWSYGYGKAIFTLDRPYVVKKINFKLYNTNGSTNQNGISLDYISFYNTKRLNVNKTYSFNNPLINLYGKWENVDNNANTNISQFSGQSIKSTTIGDSLEFYLFGSGFDIVGQKNSSNSAFDIYVNDKFVATIDTYSETRIDNSVLYSYTSDTNDKPLKVKIVNKHNKTLFLDYIQTYGSFVYLDNIKNFK